MGKGTTTQRGYGRKHQLERSKWQQIVNTEGFTCWRCANYFQPGTPFDLGHDDHDRSIYRGPECRPCNRATKARRPKTKRRWAL